METFETELRTLTARRFPILNEKLPLLPDMAVLRMCETRSKGLETDPGLCTKLSRLGPEYSTVQNRLSYRNLRLRIFGYLRSCPDSACKLCSLSSDPIGVHNFLPRVLYSKVWVTHSLGPVNNEILLRHLSTESLL